MSSGPTDGEKMGWDSNGKDAADTQEFGRHLADGLDYSIKQHRGVGLLPFFIRGS